MELYEQEIADKFDDLLELELDCLTEITIENVVLDKSSVDIPGYDIYQTLLARENIVLNKRPLPEIEDSLEKYSSIDIELVASYSRIWNIATPFSGDVSYPQLSTWTSVCADIEHIKHKIMQAYGLYMSRKYDSDYSNFYHSFEKSNDKTKRQCMKAIDFLNFFEEEKEVKSDVTYKDYFDYIKRMDKTERAISYYKFLRELGSEREKLRNENYENYVSFVKSVFSRQMPLFLQLANRLPEDEFYSIEGDGAGLMSLALALNELDYVSHEPYPVGSLARDIGMITDSEKYRERDDCVQIICNLSEFIVPDIVKGRKIIIDQDADLTSVNFIYKLVGIDINMPDSFTRPQEKKFRPDKSFDVKTDDSIIKDKFSGEIKKEGVELVKTVDLNVGQYSMVSGQYRSKEFVIAKRPDHFSFFNDSSKAFDINPYIIGDSNYAKEIDSSLTGDTLMVDLLNSDNTTVFINGNVSRYKYAYQSGNKILIKITVLAEYTRSYRKVKLYNCLVEKISEADAKTKKALSLTSATANKAQIQHYAKTSAEVKEENRIIMKQRGKVKKKDKKAPTVSTAKMKIGQVEPS